jgi:hypothetical protein
MTNRLIQLKPRVWSKLYTRVVFGTEDWRQAMPRAAPALSLGRCGC